MLLNSIVGAVEYPIYFPFFYKIRIFLVESLLCLSHLKKYSSTCASPSNIIIIFFYNLFIYIGYSTALLNSIKTIEFNSYKKLNNFSSKIRMNVFQLEKSFVYMLTSWGFFGDRLYHMDKNRYSLPKLHILDFVSRLKSQNFKNFKITCRLTPVAGTEHCTRISKKGTATSQNRTKTNKIMNGKESQETWRRSDCCMHGSNATPLCWKSEEVSEYMAEAPNRQVGGSGQRAS